MNPLRRVFILGILALAVPASAAEGNRLTYLEEDNPFYPHRSFPKLITPQWVGEPGVEAVVILAIDDMRETPKYEAFLRPILERLKQIDGRAPVSIMVNAIAPTNAQLQSWLKEGVSLEVHTLAHPCPCLDKGNFNTAAATYHGCVELMNLIPGNKPVAFRMPCCDSMNSPGPRFYAELFNQTNAAGQFLTIDSSVMCILTTNDSSLPRGLVLDADGREKFRKYLPTETNATTRVSMRSFMTTIEDYPYPYVIGKSCWEFPAMVPSDWEAFNLHGSTNAATLADWKAALDAVVLKQGVFSFIFHPHGWSSPAQFVEFINYAVRKHGNKVRFLTFKEAQERIDRNLLRGHALRSTQGADNWVRVLDVNNDGYMDVVLNSIDSVMDKSRTVPHLRIWQPNQRRWKETAPGISAFLSEGRFGVISPEAQAVFFDLMKTPDIQQPDEASAGAWFPGPAGWTNRSEFLSGLISNRQFLEFGGKSLLMSEGRDRGARLRDLDHDGRCELILGNAAQNVIFTWSETEKSWKKLPYALPRDTTIVDADGHDAGLRFVDVNGDGYDDVLFSNEKQFSLHLFVPKANPRLMWEVGWNDQVWAGKRGESDLGIPPIVRGGAHNNNGVWFKNGTMWIQNEDTAHLPDKVDRRTFQQLLTADQPQPLSPEQALASMRPRPGFKVELVAAEPLVQDPIAFEWGADGRLWVVEMGDYPLGRVDRSATNPPARSPHGEEILSPPGGGRYVPGGQIRVLEDTDGDGRYDKATVFLDGLNFPTGVMPWRNGVIVSAAPEIFYAEDTNGDGKADKRTVLFSGFVEGNQQHRVNGFDYGLDNWVYAANGESGGTIGSALLPNNATVSLRGHDCRFRPDTGEFQTVAGTTQYGRHRDDWGNWFGNNNPVWLWHYFLPEEYLARNPQLAVKTTKQLLANYPDSTRLHPASRTRQRFNDHHQLGHVTSGNSAMPYRDELFGPDYASSVFISDPVHNLVHREVLESGGVTFTSHRADEETNREFLASTDLWFRPTMLKTGPDGALYIADMYRLVIEHPEWIPRSMQHRLDLRAGSDKGRIYRVLPEGAALRKIPNLSKLDVAGLVSSLESPNGWQRDTAQRLLVHSADPAAADSLRRLSVASKNPKVRLQAICTLEGLGALSFQDVKLAANDLHPSVREQAARLAQPFLNELSQPSPAQDGPSELSRLANDPDMRVRYQTAFTLGASTLKSDVAGALLARLALKDFQTPALQTAIMSSAPAHLESVLRALFSGRTTGEVPPALIEHLMGLATAQDNRRAILAAFEAIGNERESAEIRFNAFAGLLDGLERRNRTFRQFVAESGTPARNITAQLEGLFPEARAVASNANSNFKTWQAALRVIGRAPEQHGPDLQCLGELLHPQNPLERQAAAVAAFARQTDRSAADILIQAWSEQGPALRTDTLNVLLTRPAWCRVLLAAVQGGKVPAGQVGVAFQQKLLNHPDRTVKDRAAELFASIPTNRQALLKQYADVTRLPGGAEKGMALFRQQCVACHRLNGEGNDVGPDLGALVGRDAATLLTAILDPNQAVEARYVTYTATTRGDRELSGIITAETANSITLRAPGGAEETVLRSDLNRLTSSGLSLMPEGFEKSLTVQDMSDLLAALGARK
ncbi:MAG: hypothetical protein QOF48_2924 [Verrucomicrobiota bacterium]